jgi:hypothetical protein
MFGVTTSVPPLGSFGLLVGVQSANDQDAENERKGPL